MTSTRTDPPVLTAAAMREFRGLRGDAVGALLARFREEFPSDFERISAGGRELLEVYLGSAIEFLAPVLEFGLLSPLVEYLRWSESVLLSRRLPTAHLARSLDWIAEYFATRLERDDAAVVAGALQRTKVAFSAAQHAAYAAALASDGDESGVGQAPVIQLRSYRRRRCTRSRPGPSATSSCWNCSTGTGWARSRASSAGWRATTRSSRPSST